MSPKINLDPASIAEALDRSERERASARDAELRAKEAWVFAEAVGRARLRARDDADGTRRSCKDIEADLTLARHDPKTPIGEAWLTYVEARTHRLKVSAEYEVLERAHWREIRGQ
jgi:hypothetical protein